MKTTHTKTHVKLPQDNISTTSIVKFDWKDKLKILFGFDFKIITNTLVTYNGEEESPFNYKTEEEADLRLTSKIFRKPNWMKTRGGYCESDSQIKGHINGQ